MVYEAVPMRAEEHREILLELWNRNLSGPRTAPLTNERFRLFYEQNPLGPAQTMLAIKTCGGDVVGCGSAFPWNKQINGRIIRAGVMFDFAVDKGHRFGGAAIAIQRKLIDCSRSAGFSILVGFPNKEAFGVFQRVGYRSVGDSYYWVKPLRGKPVIHKWIESRTIAKVASPGLDIVLSLMDRWRLSNVPNNYKSELAHAADDGFDELWREAKSRYRIVGERNAAYLNWRYTSFKSRAYSYYCLKERKDRLIGYIVFSADDEDVLIADMFVADPASEMWNHLLLGFAAQMRKQGARSLMLSYFGAPSFERRLQRLGFFRRTRLGTLFVYAEPDLPEDCRQAVYDRENWFLLDGEMDI